MKTMRIYRMWISCLLLASLCFAPTARAMQPAPPHFAERLPDAYNRGDILTGPSVAWACGGNASHWQIVEGSTQERWLDWIKKLSGAEPVSVGGRSARIQTRFSAHLFDGTSPAYQYVFETLYQLYQDSPQQIHEDSYLAPGSQIWKNLILEFPGTSNSEEIVILSAHLDSTSSPLDAQGKPVNPAPGADDNAGGAAALLEAAHIFKGHSFPRTIRLIWFTGEEQGLLGSGAYVQQYKTDPIVGVINMDMFTYDSNNDRCMELHVGNLAASNAVGQCFLQTAQANQLGLLVEYLTDNATNRSDHARFWNAGIGAVEIGENFFNHANSSPAACALADVNPNYHQPDDTIEHINASTGYAITRAALLTILAMADPILLEYPVYQPLILN